MAGRKMKEWKGGKQVYIEKKYMENKEGDSGHVKS